MEIRFSEKIEDILVEKERFRLQRLASVMNARMKIINEIRSYFGNEGFLEVETPIRIIAPAPESNIETFRSEERFLIASPELQMKILVMAGYKKIFQFVHCFRKENLSETHEREFTMLEWYRTSARIENLMKDIENFTRRSIKALIKLIKENMEFYRGEIDLEKLLKIEQDLKKPFEIFKIRDLYRKLAGWDPITTTNPSRFDKDMIQIIEPFLQDKPAAFLYGYPEYQASLARLSEDNPQVAQRFEFYLYGVEIANGFDELTDCEIQQKRFIEESITRAQKGMNEYPLDAHFLAHLKKGMPQTSGIALGIDRFVMILLSKNNIKDVILFPDGFF